MNIENEGRIGVKREWNIECLNPKCDESHGVKECPMTSKKYADDLIEKREERKKSRSKKSVKSTIRS